MKRITHSRCVQAILVVVLALAWGVPRARGDEVARYLKLLKHANPYVRERAARALGEQGGKEAVAPLVAALSDGTPDVRRAAVDALGQIGEASAFDAVKARLTDQSAIVRQAAVGAVGTLGGPKAVAPLIAALKIERPPAVRVTPRLGPGWRRQPVTGPFETAVIDALVSIGPPAVGPLKALLAGKDGAAKRAALRALNKLNWKPSTKAEHVQGLIELGKWDQAAALGAVAVRPLLDVVSRRSVDYEQLKRAGEALKKIRGKEAAAALVEVLGDKESPERTRDLARTLVPAFGAAAADPLLDVLRKRDPVTFPLAAEAAGKLGDKRVVPLLVSCLEDKQGAVRSAAVEALARLEWVPGSDPEKILMRVASGDWRGLARMGAAGLESLLSALNAEQDPEYRVGIIAALAETGSKRAAGPLAKIMTAPPPSAATLLDRFRAEVLDDRTAQRRVARQVRADREVRIMTAAALGRIGGEQAVEALAASLKNTSERVRTAVVSALGRTAGRRVVTLLAPVASDESRRVRLAVVKALGTCGDRRAVGTFIVLLADKESSVRAEAIAALGRSGDTRAVEPLLALLEADDDDRYGKPVALALGLLKDERAVEPLLARLEDGQWYAFEALGTLGDRRATQPLLAIASDPTDPNQSYAIRALGDLGDSRAFDALLEILNGRDKALRACAAEGLGATGDPRAFGPLMKVAKGEKGTVQCSAVMGLGALGDLRAYDTLADALKNSSNTADLRSAAANALGQLGAKQAVGLLVEALSRPDLRAAAAGALEKLAWKPTTEAQRVRYALATGNDEALRAMRAAVRAVLLADCRSGDRVVVRDAVRRLLVGGPDAVKGLSDMLDKHPSVALAEAIAGARFASHKLRGRAYEWLRAAKRAKSSALPNVRE